MAAISDRHVIKEKILDNVAKAVKSVSLDENRGVYSHMTDEAIVFQNERFEF